MILQIKFLLTIYGLCINFCIKLKEAGLKSTINSIEIPIVKHTNICIIQYNFSKVSKIIIHQFKTILYLKNMIILRSVFII